MLNSHLGFVLLFVTNPLKSAEFYSNLFNLEPLQESPTFALFSLASGIKFGLWSRYTAEPRVEVLPGAMEVCFPSENVDEFYDRVGKINVTIVQKPTDMDFGRTFVFLDPDGHRIRIYMKHKKES
jgi:predicted enzyme related to lactoylglutathione lyase